ncbi:hypothetical protein ACB092_11G114100 [Castanea dentata]
MGTKSVLSTAVLEVLANDNYEEWSARVRTYLIAQDLWQIVKTTDKQPLLENGKATFEDWNKKNSMALHVIQISCCSQAFSKIMKIKTARVAWNTLEKEYKPKHKKSSRTTVKNSSNTKSSVKPGEITSDKNASDSLEEQNPEPHDSTSKNNSGKSTKKKSSTTKSVRTKNTEISSDKTASDSMKEENPELLDSKSAIKSGKNNVHVQLYDHVRKGDWIAIKDFLMQDSKVICENLTDMKKTVLHMAVFAGQEDLVKSLVKQMSEEHLKQKDAFGYTALAETTLLGNYQMAKCMLEKDNNLVSIKSRVNLLPVVMAVFHGHMNLARYLYLHTPLKDLQEKNGYNGVTLIIQAMYTRHFDIALHLLGRDPTLAFALDREECSPFSALASMSCAFKNSNPLVFWKEWIYKSIHIELAPSLTTNEFRLNIPAEEERHKYNGVNISGSGIRRLHEMKWIHEHSHELLRLMCKSISPLNEKEQKDVVSIAIFRAIKEGQQKFVSEVLKADPYLIWARDKDRTTVFQQAVLYREAIIFRLLHEHDVKDSVMDKKDWYRNNVLHMAGKLTPSTRFKRIRGAVLQMQKELQWFKELEQIVHPKMREERNESGFTPQELFTREHNDMKNEGEEWMKNTATSCTVVAALIVTIMFAAAFTVPGGNDQNTGFPIFFNKTLFMLFIVSDALSLFSSSTSVLMFLGILTSRYAEEDFLKSLPRKMVIGLSTLFVSIAAMMTAFSAALLLMLRGQSWIFIPVICLASIPVTLFVFMQFPLLVDMFKSTFGPSIFPPKMKNWLNDVGCPVNNWQTGQN